MLTFNVVKLLIFASILFSTAPKEALKPDNLSIASSMLSNAAFAPPPSSVAPSGFAPQATQYSAGLQTAAKDAMAMFAEEENEEIIETNTVE